MKYLFLVLCLTCTGAQAMDEHTSTFLKFETDYMSNNSDKIEPWLDKKYKVEKNVILQGKKSKKNKYSRKKLLSVMKGKKFASRSPKSSQDDVKINVTPKGFCGVSEIARSVIIGGEKVDEKEVRSVCFVFKDGVHLALAHKVDVHFN